MTACYAVNPAYLILGIPGWTVYVPFWERSTGSNFLRVQVSGRKGEKARLSIVESTSNRYPVGENLLTVKQLRNSGYAHGSLSPAGGTLHRLLWAVLGNEIRRMRTLTSHAEDEEIPTTGELGRRVRAFRPARGPQYGGSAITRHH